MHVVDSGHLRLYRCTFFRPNWKLYAMNWAMREGGIGKNILMGVVNSSEGQVIVVSPSVHCFSCWCYTA